MEIILCLAMLQLKHMIVDWCWQPPYEWQNKGTYAHWGGVRHALKNAVGTAVCFLPFVSVNVMLPVFVLVVVGDFVAHYHIDFLKMNINRIKGWGPTTHEQFWWLTGADQTLHQLCYVLWLAIVFVIMV